MAYKALLVGINYSNVTNRRNRLRGCVNDITDMNSILLANGFSKENITVLTDGVVNGTTSIAPTKANLLKELEKLVVNAKPNDILVWHYSGHGAQTADLNRDESDAKDELICPLTEDGRDIDELTDDEIKPILDKLPKGAQLFGLMDSCNSGTVWDLTNNIRTSRSVVEHGYTVMISGSLDHELSTDAQFGGRPQGALTQCFKKMIDRVGGFNNMLRTVFSNNKAVLTQLQQNMARFLRRYDQTPNISYEGVLATPNNSVVLPGIGSAISASVAPLINGFKTGNYTLRSLAQRQGAGTNVFVPENHAMVVEPTNRELKRLR